MLELMRRNASSWLIKFLLGIIVLVFVFLGIGSKGSKYDGVAAVVNDESITVDEYRDAYQRLIEQLRGRFGASLNDDLIEMFQVGNQAINGLVDRKLILQQGEENNIRVADAELAAFIQEIPVFQKDGVFDGQRYKSILRQNRLTESAFEAKQREEMLSNKMRALVTGGIKVSGAEALAWYKWNDASVNVDYVAFKPEAYKEVETPEDEILAYYKENGDKYKTEPKVKVNYLRFAPEDYKGDVVVSSEEISDYYESAMEEFETPKTVEARHILIKVDQDVSEEAVKEAEKRADDVRAKATAGGDFGELAKEFSEGPSADKGGMLGAFKKEAMVKPFADKAFSMAAGEISEPVRTRFGWHVIKVEKVNEASTLTLAEAEEKIRAKLTDDAARNLAYDNAESVSESMMDGDKLEDVATERNATLHTADFFTRNTGPKDFKGNRYKFSETAFTLAEGEISEVNDLVDGYYIIQPVAKAASEIPELAEVKARVALDLKTKKQDEKAAGQAEAFLGLLKGGQSLADAAGKLGMDVKESGFFTRTGSIPELGSASAFAREAFKLSARSAVPEKAVKDGKVYYVPVFKERKEPADADFEEKKAQIIEKLAAEKATKLYSDWLADLKAKSEIMIFING